MGQVCSRLPPRMAPSLGVQGRIRPHPLHRHEGRRGLQGGLGSPPSPHPLFWAELLRFGDGDQGADSTKSVC